MMNTKKYAWLFITTLINQNILRLSLFGTSQHSIYSQISIMFSFFHASPTLLNPSYKYERCHFTNVKAYLSVIHPTLSILFLLSLFSPVLSSQNNKHTY